METADGLEQSCRLCANQITNGIHIFGESGKDFQLALMINTSLPITVKTTDTLSNKICASCFNRLFECHEFSELTIQAENKLVKNSALTMQAITNIMEEDIQSETLTNLDTDHTYSCPVCDEGTMVLQSKEGAENSLDLEEEPKDLEYGSVKELSLIEEITKATALTNWPGYEDNIQSDTSFECPADEGNCPMEQNINNGEYTENIENVFFCRLCGELMANLQTCYNHGKTHVSDTYHPCVLCSSDFFSEGDFETHFKEHEAEHMEKVRSSAKKKGVFDHTSFYKCAECNTGFYTKDRHDFHCLFHEGARALFCEMCDRKHKTETQLYRHMLQVHSTYYLFQCPHCNSGFISRAMLDEHQCIHKFNQTFECAACHSVFSDKLALTEHTLVTHVSGKKQFRCHLCGAVFTCKARHTRHIKNLHCKVVALQVCYGCSTCKALFPNINMALHHSQKHFPLGINDSSKVEEITVTKVYVCEYCEMYFAYTNNLNDHRLIHADTPTPYQCTTCDSFFQTYNQAHVHRKTHIFNTDSNNDALTDVVAPPFEVPIQFSCQLCEKDFKLWEGLYVHRCRSHGDEAPTASEPDYPSSSKNSQQLVSDDSFICEICGQYFPKLFQLDRHKKQRHTGGEFRCEDCGKVLAHLSGLVIHRRQHTGEKPFCCDLCGKRFRQSAGMYTHRRTHTKEYPYHCEVCGHGFNVKGDLNNHRRSKHTKERPFKCDVCHKAFLTSGVYYQHKMLHAGIRKYKCQYCGRDFSRWNALRLHTRTHTGEKPHVCDVCGRGFAQKGDMRKHRRTQHGVVD